MFAKTLLSLVSLLFIGNQFISVSAAITEINYNPSNSECTVTGGDEGDDNKLYVVNYVTDSSFTKTADHTNKKIVKITSSGESCQAVTAGLYIFNNDNAAIAANNVQIDTAYSVYLCDGTKCAATEGLVTNSSNVYYKVKNGQNAAAASASAAQVNNQNDCSSHVGEIVKIANTSDEADAKFICLSDTLGIALPATGNHIITGTPQGGNPFGAVTGNVIKSDANYSVLNTIIDDDEYCVGSTTNILTGTLEGFQTTDGREVAPTCDKYYECKSKVCSDVTSTSTCTRSDPCIPSTGGASCNGYYITKADNGNVLQDGEGSGFLFSCDGTSNPCSKVTDKVGYFVNASTVYGESLPYIQCKYASISGGKIVNACSVIASETISGTDECSASNVGGLISGNKLCVNDQTEDAVELKDSNTANNGEYLINDTALNVFVPSDKEAYHVLITVDDTKVELAAYNAGSTRYKYTVKNKVHGKAVANLQEGGICYQTNKNNIVEFKSDNCSTDKMNFYTKQ